jgi:DNA-binding GntR family transcriptional regulator
MRLPLKRAGQQAGLSNWVGESLRESILGGHFAPGERIDQTALADDLDVSLTPVREAWRKLEAEGFVEIRPRHGVFIPRPTPEDIHEIYDIRKQLEPAILRRLVPSMQMTTLEDLEVMLMRADQHLALGNVDGYFECDVFDETIRQLTPNRILREWLDGLNSRIMIIRRFNEFQPGPHLAESLFQHREILAEAMRRDGERAAHLMLKHLEQAETLVRGLARTDVDSLRNE